MYGGTTGSASANTELWNGTSWTEVANLNTARSDQGEFGSSANALSFGGNGPTAVAEEWSEPTLTIQEFDLS